MIKRLSSFALTVSMIFTSVIFSNFAQAVSKPTFVCKKVGQTATTNGYKFTCVKSGKNIVWNSGVKISSNSKIDKSPAQPIQTSTATPATQPTQSPAKVLLPEEGTLCNEFRKKIATDYGYLMCDWRGAYDFAWKGFRIPKLSTSKNNSYAATPKLNNPCEQSGDTFDIPSGYLECRYVKSGKLQWIQINNLKKTFTNLLSPTGTDVCKLQNSKVPPKTGRSEGQTAGFPTVARDTFINPGVNQAIVVGIDFPELRGKDSDLAAINVYDRKMVNEWYSYFSDNKVSFNLTSYDHWIHMPNAAKSYSNSGTFDSTAADGNFVQGRHAQQFFDVISKEVDLSKYKTIYMIFPDGEFTFDVDFVVRNYPFVASGGTQLHNFFGWGRDNELMGTLHWAYYIHESLHDAVLIGHAPGNGWPFSIMTNQSGISLSPFSWEQFQLGWLPDTQIFCTSKEALTTTQVSLTPMEREDKQTKSAIIKISDTEAIVVESHGLDKWSNFKTNGNEFPPGFYGVMAYLVDLNQAGAPPVSPDGRTIQDDTGNSPTYPRWAYWQPVDGTGSANWSWNYRTTPLNYNDYVAVLGDSITIKGVKIKLIGTGDYETVEISKA